MWRCTSKTWGDGYSFHLRGRRPCASQSAQNGPDKDLEDMVNFTGRIPDEQLLEILSTADVCVNPDRPCEMNDISTMIKIMEYMALGKPIVQFDLKEGRFSAQDASLYVDTQNQVAILPPRSLAARPSRGKSGKWVSSGADGSRRSLHGSTPCRICLQRTREPSKKNWGSTRDCARTLNRTP